MKNEVNLSTQISCFLKYSKNSLEEIKHMNVYFFNKLTFEALVFTQKFDFKISSTKIKLSMFLITNIVLIFCLIIICN